MSQKKHKVQSNIDVEGLAKDRRIHSEFLEEVGKVAKMYVAIDTFIGRREGKNYRTLNLEGGKKSMKPNKKYTQNLGNFLESRIENVMGLKWIM